MIKDFEPRLYQQTIFATALRHNTLVVLPTGLGKTLIAAMLASKRLDMYPDSKIMVLAPTKPLIDQHYTTFQNHLVYDKDRMVVLSGLVSPKKREELYKKNNIFFSTPQTINNDLINKTLSLKEFSLMVCDEAHRATGDYAYVWLAEQYEKQARAPRILALTASPGSETEAIAEVTKNLHIEKIEVRTEQDHDVKPYLHETAIKWVEVDLPQEFLEIKLLIDKMLRERMRRIQANGYLSAANPSYASRKDILALQQQLHADLSSGDSAPELFNTLSLAAECMKLQYALELIESQGIPPLNEYLEKMFAESHTTKVKAVKNLCMDINFRTAYIKTKSLFQNEQDHPKMKEVRRVIAKELLPASTKKIIIFTQYRHTGQTLVEDINRTFAETVVKAKLFVGQQTKNGSGLSQKNQKMTLQEFRDGLFNCLVATSVAEEGLDIPDVDVIIFYEPIPSAIRTIQRRGRTGRFDKGTIYVMVSKKTRDVAYRWSAHHKQKGMYSILKDMKKKIELKQPATLQQYGQRCEKEGLGEFEKNREKFVAEKSVDKTLVEKETNAALKKREASIAEGVGVQNDKSPATEAYSKEKRMATNTLSDETIAEEKTATTKDTLKIYMDSREKSSYIVKYLIDNNIDIKFTTLQVGDIIISNKVAIERKTVKDFVDSIIDKRLLTQIKDLKRSYEKPLLIVEGTENIYSQRNIHSNAIRGMIATIAIDYSIPIITTYDEQDTASYIIQMAKREQSDSSDFSFHANKTALTPNQELEYVISALPGVGPNIAKRLLERFKNVQNIMNASVKELSQVEGIGKGIAIKIKETVERNYRT